MTRPNFCLRNRGHAAFVQEKAPFRCTSTIWSHSLSDMFLKLNEERVNSEQQTVRSSSPFVSQDTSVVDKDSNRSESIDGGLNDSSTIRDGGSIHNSLSTS